MPAYNLTLLQNATSIPKMLDYANHVSNDMFSALLLFGLFVILVVKNHNEDLTAALLSASFICFLISGFFWFINLANVLIPLGFMAMLALTSVYYAMSR